MKYWINLAMIPISGIIFVVIILNYGDNIILFTLCFACLLFFMFYFMFSASDISISEWKDQKMRETDYRCEICGRFIGRNGKFSRSGDYLCKKDYEEVENSNMFVNWLL